MQQLDPPIDFRPLNASDFILLTEWLAEPHVRRYYQKSRIEFQEVERKYGPRVRGETAIACHIATYVGAPFAYLQCYRGADWPDWMSVTGRADGVSIDLFIGDPDRLGQGLGRAMLSAYVERVALVIFGAERAVYIGHEVDNHAALGASRAAGFEDVDTYVEDGIEKILLRKMRQA